jgi:maleylacetoacetate isomerase
VRIALAFKGVEYETVHVDLLKGEQKSPEYLKQNPQGLVPTLIDGETRLSQSLAIIEYLDELYPQNPLVFGPPAQKAKIRQLALIVACEIAPLNNLRVWKGYVGGKLGADDQAQQEWFAHWLHDGFKVYETLLENGEHKFAGPFSCGAAPSMADACLIPQVYNARRFNIDLSLYPRICDIEKACMSLAAFQTASPESHKNAPADLGAIHGPNAPFLKQAN